MTQIIGWKTLSNTSWIKLYCHIISLSRPNLTSTHITYVFCHFHTLKSFAYYLPCFQDYFQTEELICSNPFQKKLEKTFCFIFFPMQGMALDWCGNYLELQYYQKFFCIFSVRWLQLTLAQNSLLLWSILAGDLAFIS